MQNQNLPEIRIKFGWLLYNTISKDVDEARKRIDEGTFPTEESIRKKVEVFKEVWKPKEGVILSGMTEALGLTFYQSCVDVFITPFKNPISDPIVIPPKFDSDLFVDVLTHELFHCLLSDNVENIPYKEILLKEYPEEQPLVQNHVFLHAGLKYVYLDVLKEPSRLDRDIERHLNASGYNRAWEIVEKEGYNELIERFKDYYASVGS